ncbi:MAG: hypothetical protein U0872_15310 [Planctomycetaceae bacterium]
MAKFRKKPVVIEAVQWNPSAQPTDYPLWFYENVLRTPDVFGEKSGTIMIRTLEGDMTAQPGDWIIRGVQGECYPCKPDIFEATYEPVDDAMLAAREQTTARKE